MSRIVSIHSYRGGTGKSNTTANLAACAVDTGKRMAVLEITTIFRDVLAGWETE